MRFLIEELILTKKEKEDYENFISSGEDSSQQITRWVQLYLKNRPNARKLKSAITIYSDSLEHEGFDDTKNPFAYFIANINQEVPESTANIIHQLVNSKKLDVKSDWLYRNDLYNRSERDLNYTIEALTLASNEDLQKDEQGMNKFSTKDYLQIEDLMKNGKILSTGEIKIKLSNWQDKQVEAPKGKTKPKNVKAAIESIKQDTIDALISLGTDKKTAIETAEAVYKQGDTADQAITKALQNLGRTV